MSEQQNVLLRILGLANRISREFDALNAAHGDIGISGVNARILSYLVMHEDRDVFQRDLEEAFSIRRSTVSKVVQLMEAKGLLVRESVAQDARLKRLVLTDKARRIHCGFSGEVDAFVARATSALSREEIEALLALLEKIDLTLDERNDK